MCCVVAARLHRAKHRSNRSSVGDKEVKENGDVGCGDLCHVERSDCVTRERRGAGDSSPAGLVSRQVSIVSKLMHQIESLSSWSRLCLSHID